MGHKKEAQHRWLYRPARWVKPGWRSPASASGRGQPVALVGPSPGGRRTMSSRYRPSATPWRAGSTGSTPPLYTASGTPKRWSPPPWRAYPSPTGRTSSPNAAWYGTTAIVTSPRSGWARQTASGPERRHLCAGLRSMSWTCSRCTGRPTTVPASRTTGGRCSSSKSRARYAPSGSATTTWTAWRRRRLWGTWTPCNHPFQPSSGPRRLRSTGAPTTRRA